MKHKLARIAIGVPEAFIALSAIGGGILMLAGTYQDGVLIEAGGRGQVLTGIGYFSNNLLFQRYLGRINPLLASLFIIFLGVVLLSFLLSRGWFAIFKRENLKGLFRRSGLAALFVFWLELKEGWE